MEPADRPGLAREKETEESSNGSGDGNVGLEVGPDVIDITTTLGFDSPKVSGQEAENPDHSSLSSASTSGGQVTVKNTITSDTINTEATTTTPTHTTDIPQSPSPPQHKPTTPMSTSIAIRTAAPSLSMSSLADLSLHSPSSQIIGTPFASSSMPDRFEYPFPDTPGSSPPLSASTSSSQMAQMAAPQSSIASISPMMALASGSNHTLANASIVPPRMASPPSSSTTFQYSSPHHTNANTSHIPSRAATLPYSVVSGSQSHVHAQAEAPSAGPAYGSYSTYTPAHPKLRAQASAADPPVPPSLARKSRGWHLGIGMLSRRRSATAPSKADGGQRSPLESPRNEHGR